LAGIDELVLFAGMRYKADAVIFYGQDTKKPWHCFLNSLMTHVIYLTVRLYLANEKMIKDVRVFSLPSNSPYTGKLSETRKCSKKLKWMIYRNEKRFDIMEIIQIRLNKMVTFCYIIGDEATKVCALVDPAFETERILSLVKEGGYSVTHVINTHNHSDHTAGNAAIISATGAKLVIHEQDAGKLGRVFNSAFSRVLGGKGSPVPDILVKDGDRIEIGKIGLKILHTPGHTPGGICLYSEGNVFTGDTLFVGGVGRTDLPGGSMKRLLKSIHEKIYTLPGATVVLPGHDYGPYPSSTVDQEKRTNMFTMK